jgi:hypothetical protein
MNDKINGSEPSRLILPAGVQHPNAKPPEVFGVVVPAVGDWVAVVAQEDLHTNYTILAWAQIRRGEGSTILAEQLQMNGGVQVNLTLACPVLPLEPMVFNGAALVSLRSFLDLSPALRLVEIKRVS